MLRPVPFLVFLAFAWTAQAQSTHELTNVGNSFSPAVINMVAGDQIHLVLANPHTCTEVDQATWDANGNTPNAGFNFPAGEHTFSLDVLGTYYYVCTPHAGMGMKGQIIVTSGTGVQEAPAGDAVQITPNPALNEVRITGLGQGQIAMIYDAAGKLALEATPIAGGMLDISSLEAGKYSVSILDKQGALITVKPLVVVR